MAARSRRREAGDRVGGKVLVGLEAADALTVDEQDPLEYAVLAHEILGRRDLLLALGHFVFEDFLSIERGDFPLSRKIPSIAKLIG